MSSFAERLKELRETMKLTRRQLARLAGVDPSLISRYESGERLPTADNLIKLARVFDVSTDYLLGLTDNPYRNEQVPSMLAKQQLDKIRTIEAYLKKVEEYLLDLLKDMGKEDNW